MDDLFKYLTPAPPVEGPVATFDGPDLSAADHARLGDQLAAVKALMADGAWRTPEELEAATGYRWASISARIRDLRKPRFGAYTVEREGRGRGNFAYRLAAAAVPTTGG